jgi:membrane AbrB-like protein
MTDRRVLLWLALLVLSAVLALLLRLAGFPAAFLVGPMIAAIGFGVGDSRLRAPKFVFIAAQSVVGTMVASALTGSILLSLAQDWAPMALVVISTIAAGGLVGWVLTRYGRMPGTTAAWGSSPGAASVMVAMAAEYGADIRLVGFMQYLRILVVVLTASLVSRLVFGANAALLPAGAIPMTVPARILGESLAIAAAGAYLGWRLRIPAGAVLLPMAIGVALQASGLVAIALPQWVLAIAYGGLGWYIGLGFTKEVLLYALRAIPQLLAGTFMLIALGCLSAWLLTGLLHVDGLTAYLATSPGGLDSVAIIAIGSHANLAFVLATQTLRLFAVMATGPAIARLIIRMS